MKRLWIELQRWNKQRVMRCHTCNARTGRIRANIARIIAGQHSRLGHRAKVSRFG